MGAKEVEKRLTAVCQEMKARGFAPARISAARSRASGAVYEDPAQCANVAIDDVDVKKQKAHRERPRPLTPQALAPKGAPSAVASSAGKRPQVATTVARIEQGPKRFTLSGSSLGQALRFVLAFLLGNRLLDGRIHSGSYTCGHGRNPEIKRAYIGKVLRVLRQHEAELIEFLESKHD